MVKRIRPVYPSCCVLGYCCVSMAASWSSMPDTFADDDRLQVQDCTYHWSLQNNQIVDEQATRTKTSTAAATTATTTTTTTLFDFCSLASPKFPALIPKEYLGKHRIEVSWRQSSWGIEWSKGRHHGLGPSTWWIILILVALNEVRSQTIINSLWQVV